MYFSTFAHQMNKWWHTLHHLQLLLLLLFWVLAVQQSPSPMKSSNKWSSYTVSEKKALLKKVDISMEEFGYSDWKTYTKVVISHSLFLNGRNQFPLQHKSLVWTIKRIIQVHWVFSRPMKMTSWSLWLKEEILGCQFNSRMILFEAARINLPFSIKTIM